MPFSTLPRRWRTILILSLGVNVVIGGLAIGTLLDDDRGGRARPLVWALPDADRQALREALPQSSRADRRSRFEAILKALRDDPFKPEHLRALLSRQRALIADRTERAEAVIIERLTRMSAEDRAAYADRLERGVRRGTARR